MTSQITRDAFHELTVRRAAVTGCNTGQLSTSHAVRVTIMNQMKDPSPTNPLKMTCDFQIGDHVYQWCSFGGIPAVFQHHGIVLDCFCDAPGEWKMQVADFSNMDDHRSSASDLPEGTIDPSFSAQSRGKSKKRSFGKSSSQGYGIRSYEVSLSEEQWHRVDYQASWWQRQIHRSGTCTAAPSDPPGLVRARAQFLLDHPQYLPRYDAVAANCECVAVWCKTGTWATLQAVNWLVVTAAGQVKSAVTVGSIAAATQVTVPAAGFWGWMGYTTQVSLFSTQPYLLPAIIGYGVVTVAAPTLWLLRAKHLAKQTTERLNTAFWEQAIDQPEVFVECITNWSTLYEVADREGEFLNLSSAAAPTPDALVPVDPEEPLAEGQDAVVASNVSEEVANSTDSEVNNILKSSNEQSAGQHSLEGSSQRDAPALS
jgi:hypothetical protein